MDLIHIAATLHVDSSQVFLAIFVNSALDRRHATQCVAVHEPAAIGQSIQMGRDSAV